MTRPGTLSISRPIPSIYLTAVLSIKWQPHPPKSRRQKQAAAQRALALVKPGTIVGLGTGARPALHRRTGRQSPRRPQDPGGRHLGGKPGQAEAGGIPITEKVDGSLDLAVDGADEIDPAVNCVKGRGGALLREKVVAHASRRFVLIADETKLVGRLGRGPVPIEILPFSGKRHAARSSPWAGGPSSGMAPEGRSRPTIGNLVLDTSFGRLTPHSAWPCARSRASSSTASSSAWRGPRSSVRRRASGFLASAVSLPYA